MITRRLDQYSYGAATVMLQSLRHGQGEVVLR